MATQQHINATLAACALDNVDTESFDPRISPDQPLGLDQQQDLANIPVLERKLLDDVYNQRHGPGT